MGVYCVVFVYVIDNWSSCYCSISTFLNPTNVNTSYYSNADSIDAIFIVARQAPIVSRTQLDLYYVLCIIMILSVGSVVPIPEKNHQRSIPKQKE